MFASRRETLEQAFSLIILVFFCIVVSCACLLAKINRMVSNQIIYYYGVFLGIFLGILWTWSGTIILATVKKFLAKRRVT